MKNIRICFIVFVILICLVFVGGCKKENEHNQNQNTQEQTTVLPQKGDGSEIPIETPPEPEMPDFNE